ncbi:MAG: RNA polymerase-binding protein DksA [Myxococcota bacterium]
MAKKGVLTKKQLEELKKILLAERERVMESVRESVNKVSSGSERQVGDEFDSSDEDNNMYYELRHRNRNKGKLRKLNAALKRIEDGSYNECELCGESIGYIRLKARPITTMCINCKEEQERLEKQVADTEHELPNLNLE